LTESPCFLTLKLYSKTTSELPTDLIKKQAYSAFEYVDYQDPSRLRRRRELDQKIGEIMNRAAPTELQFRHWWTLSTDGFVESDDLSVHLEWILKKFRRGKIIGDLEKFQIEHFISCFWRGNGTGGGPLLSVELISVLHRQRTELAVSFYSF
jgi:hypothetical protein